MGSTCDESDPVLPSGLDLYQPILQEFCVAFELGEPVCFELTTGMHIHEHAQGGHSTQGHDHQGKNELCADVHGDRIEDQAARTNRFLPRMLSETRFKALSIFKDMTR